jgi:hypothetical protein
LDISISAYGNLLLSDGDSYSVEIPATVAGLTYLKSMLLSRKLGSVKLGQTGAPTQAQVDAMVSAFVKTRFENSYPNIPTEDLDI